MTTITPDPTLRHSSRPTTTTTQELRTGGVALAVGGVLFAVGNLLHPLQHNEAAYDSGTWEAAHVVILLGLVPLLIGLPELHRALRRRGAGTSATLAYVLGVVGFLGMAPGLLAEAFLAPEVGKAAMDRFEDTGFGGVSGAMAMGWLVSLVALTFACRKARFGSLPVQWSFAAAAVALLAVSSGTSKAAGAVIIASTALSGLATAVVGGRLLREGSQS
jgi:hypothetical protein